MYRQKKREWKKRRIYTWQKWRVRMANMIMAQVRIK